MVKAYIFVLMLIGNILFVFSQNRCEDDKFVFGDHEKLPVFDEESSGGDTKRLLEFVAKNIKYPDTAKKDSIEGRVVVEFWIEIDGSTSEHRIIRSVREDLDEEALRIARLIEFDRPTMTNGIPYSTCFNLPVLFALTKNISNGCVDFPD